MSITENVFPWSRAEASTRNGGFIYPLVYRMVLLEVIRDMREEMSIVETSLPRSILGTCIVCRLFIASSDRVPTAGRHAGYCYECRTSMQRGMTRLDYRALYAEQGGKCGICGVYGDVYPYRKGKRLVMDHDHGTGKVRGLLCRGCNYAIGILGDSPTRLYAAILYLRARP